MPLDARAVPRLGALLAALALAGCATLTAAPTDRSAGVTLPQAWSSAAPPQGGATVLADWWQHFDDPTLTALIAQALAANSDVQSAQAALRQSRALADVQSAALWPTLDASASAQGTRARSTGTASTYRAGFDASWEPDIFGGIRSASAASDLDAQASAASLGEVQVSVAAEVALDYITLRSTEARLEITLSNLASQQETLQITQWRVQAGLATSLDSEQARTLVEQTRSLIPAQQTGIALSRHQLALLTGRTIAEVTLPSSSALPQAPADLVLSFPAETLRQRPDVRAAELKVGAAAQRVVQADAARYPSFNLGGSLGLAALTFSGLGSANAILGTLLAGVSVPVFDGGAAKAQVRSQEAGLDLARSAHRAAVLGALKDVEDALVTLKGDRDRLATLRAAAEAAGNAALLARNRYEGGVIDFQTVLQTQRTQLGTEDSVAAASADLAADHVRLYKALGGGWQPDTTAAANAAPGQRS